jgi:hypothetical protein
MPNTGLVPYSGLMSNALFIACKFLESISQKPMIEMTMSILLATIFVASALPKLRHPRGFVLIVLEYRVLPAFLGQLYGWLLPPLEFFLALLLFSGVYMRLAALAVALIVASFLVAIISNMLRGRTLECNCFGTAQHRKVGWLLVLEDSLLLGIAITLATIVPSWMGVERWSVFRLMNVTDIKSGLPLLICLGLTAGGTALLHKFTLITQRFKQKGRDFSVIPSKGDVR